ncbi:MAG: SDR family oxidoreductase [Pseudomonadota bacterium]
MNILVIGASRGIGLATVKQALSAGHRVRALARSAQRIDIRHEGFEAYAGDALDQKTIEGALEGVDAVVQALGVPLDQKLLTGPISLFSKATEMLTPAMEAAGVKRLISVTGFGAGESRAAISPLERLPFLAVFGRAYDDKSRQEDLIKASALDWTIVRPGVLTNGRQTQKYRVLINSSDWRNGVISRGDVAHFILRQLEDPTLVGAAPVIVR